MSNPCDSFDPSAWTHEFPTITQLAQDEDASKPGFGWLPAGWKNEVKHKLTLYPAPRSECGDLLELAECRKNKDVLAAINEQAEPGNAGLVPVLDGLAKGKAIPPVTRILKERVFKLVRPPLFVLKAQYNRARPMHCCGDELDPMFPSGPPPHRLHPGHPAYPGGHAATAMSFALVLGDFFPGKKAAMIKIAQEVGKNREIAGLHFPSDTVAGEQLAAYLAPYLLQCESIKELREDVLSEWP